MTDNSKKANRLANATSPYLLQHAYNPVDWFQWGDEALTKAIREDKPILISIGYSSCHWCHVMERESFEQEDIAQIMNEHFVCIKVDREERPDIDQVYMEAVQAMRQHGGWPLNVFLTPEQKPFFGGTYFPPKNWAQLLLQLHKAFRERRFEIDQSAESLRNHLQTSDLQRFAQEPGMEKFVQGSLDNMFSILAARFDRTWGGIEKAPKFVMPSIWQLLLKYYSITGRKEPLDMVNLTLLKMTQGGLYDQIAGGFSRYSVDAEWFAPHFEKMLYDNAQLLSLYSETYTLTKNGQYKNTIYETISWLKNEMTHPDNGFYSALDADSEGVEGKYYTWTWGELIAVLGDNSLAGEYFHATPEGNWENGRNILIRSDNKLKLMQARSVSEKQIDAQITIDKRKLLEERIKRIHPGLDDKIVTGWNAMMVQGLVDAYKAFGDPSVLEMAVKNMLFLESALIIGNKVYRTFKNKHSETEGFLEDYAFLVQAYSSLYQVTFQESWLRKAEHWCRYTLEYFYDEGEGYFHFSSKEAEKLIAKKKEIFDNVIPSSNSVMARNLFHLGVLLDEEEWRRKATDMTSRLASTIESAPENMSHWGILFSEIIHGLAEVVIIGKDAEKKRKELHQHHLPFVLTLGTETKSDLPLLQGRESKEGTTMIYVCFNKTCKLPVDNVNDAMKQLMSNL